MKFSGKEVALKATKPGWLARLFYCGTGSYGLEFRSANQNVSNLENPACTPNFSTSPTAYSLPGAFDYITMARCSSSY